MVVRSMGDTQPTVAVIIPTLNAQAYIRQLLEALLEQSLQPRELLVVDSSSDDETVRIASSFDQVRCKVIDRATFNHGTTRHEAFLETQSEYVCFMTQDALPKDRHLLQNLIRPMIEDEGIAMASGRQLPKADAWPFEAAVRSFNYPATTSVRTSEDVQRLGIKAFLVTNVISAYRRSHYMACGGFQATNTAEDLLMASAFYKAGLKVAYVAEAEVFHSHNLSFREQYRRNYSVGFFLESHPDAFGETQEYGEGMRLVRHVCSELLHEGKILDVGAFGVDCVARILGNRMGRRAARKESLS